MRKEKVVSSEERTGVKWTRCAVLEDEKMKNEEEREKCIWQ